MSRHPSSSQLDEQNLAEDYVNFVCSNAVPKAMTLEEIKQETKEDVELQAVIKAVETDHWNSPEIPPYKKLNDELSVYNGLVLRGNRIAIPASLRSKAVDLSHQGHQGIFKTKQLIRNKGWFPGKDKMAEQKVQNCLSLRQRKHQNQNLFE